MKVGQLLQEGETEHRTRCFFHVAPHAGDERVSAQWCSSAHRHPKLQSRLSWRDTEMNRERLTHGKDFNGMKQSELYSRAKYITLAISSDTGDVGATQNVGRY
jgi:hypothetical protein